MHVNFKYKITLNGSDLKMEKILQKIIETDKSSREKVAVQKERLAMIEDEIASEKIGIDRHLQQTAENEIQKAKNILDDNKQAEIHRIDENFTETENSLKRLYRENQEKWVNDIFENITK